MVLTRDSRTYEDGHTVHLEIGQGNGKGYIFGIATTGYLKFKELPEADLAHYIAMDLDSVAGTL